MRRYKARQFTDSAAALIVLTIALYAFVAALIVSVFFIKPSVGNMAAILLVLCFVTGALTILVLVMYNILLYRMWKQIQDLPARHRAGEAVGLLFVPIFNLYWLFVAFHGLSRELNRYIRIRGVDAAPVGEGLTLATCILLLLSILPYVGFVVSPLATIFWLISLSQMAQVSAAIARARSAHMTGFVS